MPAAVAFLPGRSHRRLDDASPSRFDDLKVWATGLRGFQMPR